MSRTKKEKKDDKSSSEETDFLLIINKPKITKSYERAAGVVVSCKIPILATRVWFPGDAALVFPPYTLDKLLWMINGRTDNVAKVWVPAWPNG